MILSTLILWIFTHFLADGVMGQNQWLADNKGKRWLAMVVHAGAYAAAFAVTRASSDWAVLLVLFSTHMMIDPLKARWRFPQRFFHWLLPWNIYEVREYLARSTKPFHDADASDAVIESREGRLNDLSMWFDQALHLAVVVGLWATRGQSWEMFS